MTPDCRELDDLRLDDLALRVKSAQAMARVYFEEMRGRRDGGDYPHNVVALQRLAAVRYAEARAYAEQYRLELRRQEVLHAVA